MRFLITYIKNHKNIIIAFLIFCMVFAIIFYFYDIPIMATLYPSIICVFISIVFIAYDLYKAYRKHKYLSIIKNQIEVISNNIFQMTTSQDDIDYQEIIYILKDNVYSLENNMNDRYLDMINYYTMWVHQIKTPIASIKLNLQNDDSDLSRLVSEDIFRIEQYVEMVLCYLRLNSKSTDYLIKEYNLDDIIKQSVKKFASQFIHRRIKLEYKLTNVSVVTDEKWLLFVLEQIISNALKYTPKGNINIYLEEPKTLCIKDTGIGIASEDLPRIFEKGYTGYNGRSDKCASGIGLYLCKTICNKLGHSISAVSSIDNGTTIKINLEQIKLTFE